MAREIHYASFGGFTFQCYNNESRKHYASGVPIPGWKEQGWKTPEQAPQNYKYPPPQSRTDLRQVTCPRCWGYILQMAMGRK